MLKRHNKNSNSSREESYFAFRKTCSRKISYFSITRVCCKVSGACLVLLTFLLINPAVTSANALESEEVTSGNGEPATQADPDTSRIEISFTPTAISGEMTPTAEAGLKKQLEATATITIQNAEDYTIYIGAKTTGLVGVNSGEIIESIKSATSYEDLVANSWGIYYGEGTSVPANATYLPVETSRGAQIEAGGRTTSALTKTYALGFAANINNHMPADTYENQITLSVVSSPLEITGLTTLTEMQQMTSAVCEASEIGDETQLKDIRDGKYYWVTKLADGKCWMTQNLALDLATSPNASGGTVKTFTNADTDLNSKSSWTPTSGTYNTVTSSTILADNTGQRSWNLGSYYIKTPNGTTSCGSQKNSLANCTSYFTALAVPTSANGDVNAHYLTSHYYQWDAATAGSGGTITEGQAQDSICPKGWKLPESNSIATGSFGGLLSAYSLPTGNSGITSAHTEKLTSAPLYFVRGGVVYQSTNLFLFAGNEGNYWSSTPYSNGGNAYDLGFWSTDTIYPSVTNERSNGYSVRCIAR